MVFGALGIFYIFSRLLVVSNPWASSFFGDYPVLRFRCVKSLGRGSFSAPKDRNLSRLSLDFTRWIVDSNKKVFALASFPHDFFIDLALDPGLCFVAFFQQRRAGGHHQRPLHLCPVLQGRLAVTETDWLTSTWRLGRYSVDRFSTLQYIRGI